MYDPAVWRCCVLGYCELVVLLIKEKQLFADQGIELEPFGQNKIAIKTSPPNIQNHDIKEIILETVAFIAQYEQMEQSEFRKKLNEHVHTHMACKAAVKAGYVLEIDQMKQIIDDLHEIDNKLTCPHGRPTTWTLSLFELEKKFKRK